MRASSLFLGALLARTGAAALTLPAAAPSARAPSTITCRPSALSARPPKKKAGLSAAGGPLHGARLRLPGPSVGATENAMLAALGADGCTTIENAACEPEIADLGAFLCACGADLRGAGTPRIEIKGRIPAARRDLHHPPRPHRDCDLSLRLRRLRRRAHAPPRCTGVLRGRDRSARAVRLPHPLRPRHDRHPSAGASDGLPPVTARPYPGFPTDAMPVLLAAQLGAQGKTSFTETIFENRFLYVQELQKLGAKLSQDGRTVRLQGAEPLHAARLHAGDLRGGAALVLGAMQAEGESTIFGVKHIQRGYDNLEAALQSAGARLKTVEIPIKV